MPLGANVVVSTARPAFNATTQVTGPSTAYLTDVEGTMRAMPAQAYTNLPPELAYKAIYELRVDVDTDIAEGDRLESIALMDGATTWPPNLTGVANVSWIVRYVEPTSPLILPTRCVYVELVRAGGKAHA